MNLAIIHIFPNNSSSVNPFVEHNEYEINGKDIIIILGTCCVKNNLLHKLLSENYKLFSFYKKPHKLQCITGCHMFTNIYIKKTLVKQVKCQRYPIKFKHLMATKLSASISSKIATSDLILATRLEINSSVQEKELVIFNVQQSSRPLSDILSALCRYYYTQKTENNMIIIGGQFNVNFAMDPNSVVSIFNNQRNYTPVQKIEHIIKSDKFVSFKASVGLLDGLIDGFGESLHNKIIGINCDINTNYEFINHLFKHRLFIPCEYMHNYSCNYYKYIQLSKFICGVLAQFTWSEF